MRFFSHGPTDHPGAAGLVPVPARDAHAFQSRGIIHGSPGTEKIAAPAPGAVPQQWNRALHRSSDAPQWWLPALYYERPPLSPSPVSVSSDNQIPVPAIDPRGTPAVMARRPVLLGQRQVVQPRSLSAFPSWSGQ